MYYNGLEKSVSLFLFCIVLFDIVVEHRYSKGAATKRVVTEHKGIKIFLVES